MTEQVCRAYVLTSPCGGRTKAAMGGGTKELGISGSWSPHPGVEG